MIPTLFLSPLLALLPTPDPLAGTLARFPGPAAVAHNLALAEAHREWLDSRGAATSEDWAVLEAWKAEAAERRLAWQHLAWARERTTETESEVVDFTACRRDQLELLRRDLGAEAFRRGEMPFPLPTRFFRRID